MSKPTITLPSGKAAREPILYALYCESTAIKDKQIFEGIITATGGAISVRSLKAYKKEFNWQQRKEAAIPEVKKQVKKVEPELHQEQPPVLNTDALVNKGQLTKAQIYAVGEAIINIFSTGDYTIAAACESQGFSRMSFWNWCNQYSDLKKAYENARLLVSIAQIGHIEFMRNRLLVNRLEQDKVIEETVLYRKVLENGKTKLNEAGLPVYEPIERYVRSRQLTVNELAKIDVSRMPGYDLILASLGDRFDAASEEELDAYLEESTKLLNQNNTDGTTNQNTQSE